VPIDAFDSGWSFTCGADRHRDEEVLVVGIATVLERDESVREALGIPTGCVAFRSRREEPWTVQEAED
jgi:hypothetical protein